MTKLFNRVTSKIVPKTTRRTKPVEDPVQAEAEAHEEDRRLSMSDMIVRALAKTQWKPIIIVIASIIGAIGVTLDRMPSGEDVRAAVNAEVAPLREDVSALKDQIRRIELELAVEKAMREARE